MSIAMARWWMESGSDDVVTGVFWFCLFMFFCVQPGINIKGKMVNTKVIVRVFERFFGKAHELIISKLRCLKFDVTQPYLQQASVLANRLESTVLCVVD